MARPRQLDPLVVKRAQTSAASTTSVDTLRQCQAVLLPVLFGATLEQTATVLGVGRATVARLQTAFRKKKSVLPNPARNWGGRRESLLPLDEEEAFLKHWLEIAATGNLVFVSPIRAALAQRLGQPVKASVVYRLLARHGWRKVAPDTHHPKSNPVVQEEWKKTSGSVGSVGNPVDIRRGPGAPHAVDVSR
jgi:transposase